MKFSLRIAGWLALGVCLLVASAPAEEHAPPLITGVSSTILGGYVDSSLPLNVQRQQQLLNVIRQQYFLYCFSHHLNPYQFSFWNFLWLPPKAVGPGPGPGNPFPSPLPPPP